MADPPGAGGLLSGWPAFITIAARRLVHDRLVAVAVGLTVIVGLVQMASAPIYTEAVTVGALRWAVGDAPIEATTIRVELSTAPETIAAVDGAVADAIVESFSASRTTVSRRLASGSYQLPEGIAGGSDDERVDLTVLTSIGGMADHATLIDGAWPDGEAGLPAGDGVVPAAVEAGVAERLGLELGQVLDLTPRRDGSPVSIEVIGRYMVDDRSDRFWADNDLLTSGVVPGRSFRTFGPLIVSERVMAGGEVGRLSVTWHVDPDLSRLTADQAQLLAARANALPGRVDASLETLPSDVTNRVAGLEVSTGLAAVIEETDRSIAVTRSGLIAISAQLGVLAGMALAIAARLLTNTRRDETGLLEARGSGRRQRVALAAVEAVLLIGPAALAAPWLAARLLRWLGRRGPLGAVGFPIEPSTVPAAYVVVAVTAAVMFGLFIGPVIRPGRTSGSAAGARVEDRRSGSQRTGLDIALLVLTIAAFWQLGRLGPGRTSVIGDRFSIDPLLMITPSLALLAGAVLTLRVVPLLAGLAERIVVRGRSMVATLVGWQVARRPGEQGRSLFLLALALAIGGFAATYAATWRGSQVTQADRQVGADARVLPDRRTGESILDLHLRSSIEAQDGVSDVLPVVRFTGAIPAAESPATFMAVDAETAADVVLVSDEDQIGLEQAMGALAQRRPTLPGVELPGAPAQLVIRAGVEEERIPIPEEEPPDQEAGEIGDEEDQGDGAGGDTEDESADTAEPQEQEFLPIGFFGQVHLVIQDGDGQLHRLELGQLSGEDEQVELGLDLLDRRGDTPVRPSGPLRIVRVEFRLLPPEPPARSAVVELGPLTVIDEAGERTALPLAAPDSVWSVEVGGTLRLAQAAEARVSMTAADGGDQVLRLDVVTGSANSQALVELDLRPGAADLPDRLPIAVSEQWLEQSGSEVGDLLELPALPVPGSAVEIVAVHPGLPAVDIGAEAVVVDLPTLQMLSHRPGRPVEDLDELWLALDPEADRGAVVTTLTGPPFSSVSVEEREAVADELLADPVALAAIGAYAVAAAAAAVFAVVVFVTSAVVSARQRRSEFLLLRALGLSPRQFVAWMAAEQVVLLVLAVVLGAIVGLGLSLVVLPRLAIDQAGQTVVPTPRTIIPWFTVAAIQLLPAMILVVTSAVMAYGSAVDRWQPNSGTAGRDHDARRFAKGSPITGRRGSRPGCSVRTAPRLVGHLLVGPPRSVGTDVGACGRRHRPPRSGPGGHRGSVAPSGLDG